MNSSQTSGRNVVITGLGILSPIGIGVETFRSNLSAGNSGVSTIELMPFSAAPKNVGAEVPGFEEKTARKTYLKSLRKSVKVMCREIQLGVASAVLAVENAALPLDQIDHARLGVDFGANTMSSPPSVLKDPAWACVDADDPECRFHFERWGSRGLNVNRASGMGQMEPLWLLRYLPNMPACHIGIMAAAHGPNNSVTMAEASGNLAISEAREVILRGAADVMISGTTGTRVHPVKTLHAALWDELACAETSPETWCRPFDRDRTGQVAGEGACSLILEEEAHARARGANVLATIRGAGASCVVDRRDRPNLRRALANAMRVALKNAGLRPEQIGHINAHGLGQKQADIDEAAAIHDVFGPRADSVPVTALKSYLGNSASGCGTLELAGSVVSLRDGVVPPTLNYETPDPDCPLNVVHGDPLETGNRTVLNINVSRMGQASALIVDVHPA